MSDAEDKIEKIEHEQEEKLAQQIAKVNSLTYLSPIQAHFPLPLITREEAQAAEAAVIKKKDDGEIYLVVKNPKNEKTQNLVKKLESEYEKVTLFVVSEPTFNTLIENYPAEIEKKPVPLTQEINITDSNLSDFIQKKTTITKLGEDLKNISKVDTSKALEALLSGAIALRATDIHIEPQENTVIVRVKIDGILYEVAQFEEHLYKLILSRIKLLSDLKLNIHDEAQEGNFSIKYKDREIEIRSSVLPSQYAEDVALRILDPKALLSLPELGIREDLFKILKKYLSVPQGLILVTGPTGSGKTTTLYACINFIKREAEKIITIEDPIEYHLDGITQTEVNEDENYTFASGLKAILRQDPDTIIISELRDIESAEPTLQAALAGRKVFSTLHTIDAAGTAPRLIDMGAEPPVVSSALLVSVSQRLVRKLCNDCKKKRTPTKDEFKFLSDALGEIPKTASTPSLNKKTGVYSSNKEGCIKCGGTGYMGRIGIFELFTASKKVRDKIEQSPTEDEMREIMKEQGETNMVQDAVIKILEGTTSIEEVERVFGELI